MLSGNNELKHKEHHNTKDPLLNSAENRLAHLNKWWPRLYAWNCWLAGTAVILTGVVPFGLGLLLYIPEDYARTLNVILIVLTAIVFVAQVWNTTQRNRERALHLRRIASELDSAIVSYKSGIINAQNFLRFFENSLNGMHKNPRHKV